MAEKLVGEVTFNETMPSGEEAWLGVSDVIHLEFQLTPGRWTAFRYLLGLASWIKCDLATITISSIDPTLRMVQLRPEQGKDVSE